MKINFTLILFRYIRYIQAFFGHFEKNSRPKKLKPKKTQADFQKTQQIIQKLDNFPTEN